MDSLLEKLKICVIFGVAKFCFDKKQTYMKTESVF